MSTTEPKAARWYAVDIDGAATLCVDQADAEQVAKTAQEVWPHMGPHRAVRLVEVGDAGFTASDMATAAAQGFRDGQAAGDAGTVASCDYKSMFDAAVSTIATISEALGIDEEEAACANGAELILEAIQRKNDAFNSSHTLTLCLAEDQLLPTPQADSQPAPANTRQIAECYGDCPEDPKTCANPCKFEGRAARAPADSVLEDAARYRWIRGPVEESTRYSRWRIEYWDGPNGWQPMQRERMDSAIDAAMNKGGAA